MRHLLTLSIAALFSFGLLLPLESDAARLGGGKSFGMQRSAPTPSTPPRSSAATAQQRPSSGASRWLGPLAGLAAGGLLAALLFGDAFDSLQLFDFLLIAGIAFAIFMFMRRRRTASQPAMAGAGAPYQREQSATGFGNTQPPQDRTFATPEIGSALRGEGPRDGLRQDPLPNWFERSSFLDAARNHFIRLQAAWDQGDMRDLQEYTTPELFAALSAERQEHIGADNFTEVVELAAELVGFEQGDGFVLASVRYSGLIREVHGAEAAPFSEMWHIRRATDSDNANWYVAGIQQLD